MSVQFFENQNDFRNWLIINHSLEKEIWIGFHNKKSIQMGISYKEALDEALCFGWIDGIRKSVDEHRYTNRFTPRTAKSIWSQVNINRVLELTDQGKMHASGMKAFENRDIKLVNLYSFEQEQIDFPEEYLNVLKENKIACDFFEKQAASYKKPVIWWVISAKQKRTQLKRLSILIECSNNNEKIPPLRRQ